MSVIDSQQADHTYHELDFRNENASAEYISPAAINTGRAIAVGRCVAVKQNRCLVGLLVVVSLCCLGLVAVLIHQHVSTPDTEGTQQSREWEESLNHWTSCSVTCGPGARARVGQCNTNTTNCSGHKIELQPCNLGNCTATREWEESLNHWTSCSVTCGPGARARVGQCNTNTTNCSGHKIELQPCNLGNCTATRACSSTCCPVHWTKFQCSCYRTIDSPLNFTDAEGECKELGGHLVHIETSAEQSFIKDLVMGGLVYWIGLDDRETEGVWKWTGTDTIANFTYWFFGQPNEGTRANCAVIFVNSQQWYDWSCSDKELALCEKVIETKYIVG